jgi:hygromycin-B 7''-O-kinase
MDFGGSSVPLHQAPFLTLSDRQLGAVIERHRLGIALDEVQQLASTGIVHTIYALGNDLVLRVPKLHPEAIADSYTGMVATPAAVAAGVSTPDLVAFDDAKDIVPVPFSIFERARGEALLFHLEPHPQVHASIWQDVGGEIALLHTNVTECPDPNGYLDTHERLGDHESLLSELRAGGYLSRDAAAWLDEVLTRLRPAVAPEGIPRRFIHGDVTPANILIRDGRYDSLIDWDDAGWGDPAFEFVTLPIRAVDAALAGYRSALVLDSDDPMEQRILWDKLIGALVRLRLSPEAPTSPTSPTLAGRLFELLAAAADGDTPILRHLRHKD